MIKGNFKKMSALTLSFAIVLCSKAFALSNPQSIAGGDSSKNINGTMCPHKHHESSYIKLYEKLGITQEDVINAQKSNTTIFDLAKSKGYTPDQVRKIFIEIKTDSINKAVVNGKLTKSEGDAAITKTKEKVSNWDGTIKLHGKHNSGHGFYAAIKDLGITDQELANAKKSNKTLFDLAKEKKGMTPDQVRAALFKSKTETLNKKVAEGKITKEKADSILVKMKSKLEKWDGNLNYQKP